MSKLLGRLEKNFNAMPIYPVVLVIIFLNKFNTRIVGGEEQYLGLARQFFNPNWISGSFTLTEYAGTRWLFQIMTGWFADLVGIENGFVVLRIINFILIAHPLSLLLRKLNFTNVEVLILLQIFLISRQSFVGREWMIASVEPKTFAYIFVLYALYYFINNRQYLVYIHLAIATYFHFLVGAWIALPLGLVSLFYIDFKNLVKYVSVYVLILIPFIWYLYLGYFQNVPSYEGINLDKLYVYLRLPHHLGIFRTMQFFWKVSAIGVFWTILSIVFIGWLLRKSQIQFLRQLMIAVLVMFGIHILFVFIAYLDHFHWNDSSKLLKYYPFRSSSVAMLITMICGIVFIRQYNLSKYLRFGAISMMLIMPLLVINNIKRSTVHNRKEPLFIEAVNYVKENTPEGAIFMLYGLNDKSQHIEAFMRLTERENFYVMKFTPAEKEKLYQWYQRRNFQDKIDKGIIGLNQVNGTFGITHLFSHERIDLDASNLIFSNEAYFVYELLN